MSLDSCTAIKRTLSADEYSYYLAFTNLCNMFDTHLYYLFIIPDKEHQCIRMPDIEFNQNAFKNYLLFTLSSLVIMVIDTVGSSCVIVQCFIRMCLMSCYNFVSSICQMITFLPTCCIFFLTSKLNCFCASNICKYNNNPICLVITGLIIIWLLYFGGIAYILKIAGLIKNSAATTVAVTHVSSSSPSKISSRYNNTTPGIPKRQSSLVQSNSMDISKNPMREGQIYLYPDSDPSYPLLSPDQVFHAESQAEILAAWPSGDGLSQPANLLRFLNNPRSESKFSKTTFEKFEHVMSQLFASTRNFVNLPSIKKTHSFTSKAPTVHSFLRSILSPNSRVTLPMLANSFITTPKTNGTETIHRDMFRRFWQQGKFCG